MKRVAVAVFLVALLSVAACGRDESKPAAVQVPEWAHVGPEQIAEARKHGVPVGGPSVDDLAGVYRFDPHPGIDAIEVGPDDEGGGAVMVRLFQLGLKTTTLTLKPDGSLTWTMKGWGLEKGRWEVKDGRVFIFMKREGREEWPTLHGGLLVRDGSLVIELADKPVVLGTQEIDLAGKPVVLRKQ